MSLQNINGGKEESREREIKWKAIKKNTRKRIYTINKN